MCKDRAPLLADGAASASVVFAFGHNEAGQLGLGDTTNRLSPTRVTDLSAVDVVQMDCGGWNSACATGSGEVYTCGDGTQGKTGHPDMVHEELKRFFPLAINF